MSQNKRNRSQTPSTTPSVRKGRKNRSQSQKKQIQAQARAQRGPPFILNDNMAKLFVEELTLRKWKCTLCDELMLRQNVYRHILESSTHENKIIKPEDREGHIILVGLIKEVMAKNRAIYKKRKENTDTNSGDYLKFLAFCLKQNFSFSQISSLGKFL